MIKNLRNVKPVNHQNGLGAVSGRGPTQYELSYKKDPTNTYGYSIYRYKDSKNELERLVEYASHRTPTQPDHTPSTGPVRTINSPTLI